METNECAYCSLNESEHKRGMMLSHPILRHAFVEKATRDPYDDFMPRSESGATFVPSSQPNTPNAAPVTTQTTPEGSDPLATDLAGSLHELTKPTLEAFWPTTELAAAEAAGTIKRERVFPFNLNDFSKVENHTPRLLGQTGSAESPVPGSVIHDLATRAAHDTLTRERKDAEEQAARRKEKKLREVLKSPEPLTPELVQELSPARRDREKERGEAELSDTQMQSEQRSYAFPQEFEKVRDLVGKAFTFSSAWKHEPSGHIFEIYNLNGADGSRVPGQLILGPNGELTAHETAQNREDIRQRRVREESSAAAISERFPQVPAPPSTGAEDEISGIARHVENDHRKGRGGAQVLDATSGESIAIPQGAKAGLPAFPDAPENVSLPEEDVQSERSRIRSEYLRRGQQTIGQYSDRLEAAHKALGDHDHETRNEGTSIAVYKLDENSTLRTLQDPTRQAWANPTVAIHSVLQSLGHLPRGEEDTSEPTKTKKRVVDFEPSATLPSDNDKSEKEVSGEEIQSDSILTSRQEKALLGPDGPFKKQKDGSYLCLHCGQGYPDETDPRFFRPYSNGCIDQGCHIEQEFKTPKLKNAIMHYLKFHKEEYDENGRLIPKKIDPDSTFSQARDLIKNLRSEYVKRQRPKKKEINKK